MSGCFSHFVVFVQFVAIVSRCLFCKLRWNFCSVSHLKKHMFTWTSSKGHDLWFVIGGFRSVWFVSVFQGLLLVIVLFRAIMVSLFPKFFWAVLFLLSLARIKQCLPPYLDKTSTHHRDFLRHLFSVLFLYTKLGKRVQTLWFALTSPPLKRLT